MTQVKQLFIVDLETLHYESCGEDVHDVTVVGGKFSFTEGIVKGNMLSGKKTKNFPEISSHC